MGGGDCSHASSRHFTLRELFPHMEEGRYPPRLRGWAGADGWLPNPTDIPVWNPQWTALMLVRQLEKIKMRNIKPALVHTLHGYILLHAYIVTVSLHNYIP